MTRYGYFLSCEEYEPAELVRQARLAEQAGFDALWISDHFTTWFINPLENLIAGSPWFITGLAILGIALIVGGWRACVAALICLAGIRWLGLWNDTMVTLTSTLVATILNGVGWVMTAPHTTPSWVGTLKDQRTVQLVTAGPRLVM